jgi:hypothetical protein
MEKKGVDEKHTNSNRLEKDGQNKLNYWQTEESSSLNAHVSLVVNLRALNRLTI